MQSLWTVEQVKDYAASRGSHFFDRDTMRFFKSRILSGVSRAEIGGEYLHFFITSERSPYDGRRYTVRVMDENGSCDTAKEVGDFMAFSSAAGARRALKRYLDQHRDAR